MPGIYPKNPLLFARVNQNGRVKKLMILLIILTAHKIDSLQNILQNNTMNKETINCVTSHISHIFEESTNKIFPTDFSNSRKPHKNKNDKPWFGGHCKSARRRYHIARKRFNTSKNNDNRCLLSAASKDYKRTMKRYINKYRHDREHKLRLMQYKSPKQYWKYLNSINVKPRTNHPSLG